MASDDFLKMQIMAYLQRNAKGKENAIARENLLHHLQLWQPDLDDRKMRQLYSNLPICSTASLPRGLYIPISEEELEGFLREYSTHAKPIRVTARRQILYKAYPNFIPSDNRQLGLFNV